MLAQVALVLAGITLAHSSKLPHCDGRHSKLYIAEPIHNKPITSPNYPSVYGYTGACKWLIERSFFDDDSYILKVVFNDFDLDGEYASCSGADDLNFYDGPSLKSPLLGKYCGRTHPNVIYSTGRYLFVSFNGHSYTHRGFSFNVSVVKKEEASAICRLPYSQNSVMGLNGTSGTFFSPDYPAIYPNGAVCNWTITVPAGKVVKAIFEDFNITMEYSDCTFVEIRDSLSSNGAELARSSCEVKRAYFPPAVFSTGRYMWVKFQSKYSNHGRHEDSGFKIHFEAVDQPVDRELCLPGNVYNNFLSFTAEKGTLVSPMKYYPPNLNCVWFITVPEGNIVYVTIKRFDLDPVPQCGDTIEFLDGPHPFNERLTTLCGYSSPPDVVHSRSRYMTVKFRSDAEYRGRHEGFEFTFTAVPESDGLHDKSLAPWKITVIALVLGSVLCIFCVVCVAKQRRAANSANNEASIPMAPSSDMQPPSSPPGYPYPPYSPPLYPAGEGEEKETPQYPPPGESYPWLQNNPPSHPV